MPPSEKLSENGLAERAVALLTPLGPVRARRMFGGWGIFHEDLMFALIAWERLFFRVDAETKSLVTEQEKAARGLHASMQGALKRGDSTTALSLCRGLLKEGRDGLRYTDYVDDNYDLIRQDRTQLELSAQVDDWVGSLPPTDQRGVRKPIDGNLDGVLLCDIGAVEYRPPSVFQDVGSEGGVIVFPPDRE